MHTNPQRQALSASDSSMAYALPPNTTHHSYLLRLWRSGDGVWRASLQAVQTGERHMFADLERLFAFLVEQSLSPPKR